MEARDKHSGGHSIQMHIKPSPRVRLPRGCVPTEGTRGPILEIGQSGFQRLIKEESAKAIG